MKASKFTDAQKTFIIKQPPPQARMGAVPVVVVVSCRNQMAGMAWGIIDQALVQTFALYSAIWKVAHS